MIKSFLRWLGVGNIRETIPNKFAGMSVAELKRAGHDVRVEHWRYSQVGAARALKSRTNSKRVGHLLENRFIKNYAVVSHGQVFPRGGKTLITVKETETGKIYQGSSVCSIEDAYNRKRGNEIAISRLELIS